MTKHLYLHVSTLLIFICAYLVGLLPQTAIIYSVSFVHELFHLGAALALGETVKRVSIMPYGCELTIAPVQKAGNEMLIAAAGPAFNLAAALFALAFYPGSTFLFSNLTMLMVNLCPILPLDGGRILRAVLCFTIGTVKSDKVMKALSYLFAILFIIGGGILLFLSRFNASLLLIGGFLWAGAAKAQKAEDKIKDLTAIGHKLGKHPIMKGYEICATGDTPARKLLDLIPVSSYCAVTIVDPNGRIVGRITEQQLLSGMMKLGAGVKLKEIL